MRLCNLACDPDYLVTFEGHSLTVIEADGVETKVCFMDRYSSPKQLSNRQFRR